MKLCDSTAWQWALEQERLARQSGGGSVLLPDKALDTQINDAQASARVYPKHRARRIPFDRDDFLASCHREAFDPIHANSEVSILPVCPCSALQDQRPRHIDQAEDGGPQ